MLMIYDVFISYSRMDSIVADDICKTFTDIGLKVFTDRNNIPPGADYVSCLEKSIKRCKFFLFISSKNSYESKWCYRELNKFLNDHDIACLVVYSIDDYPLPDVFIDEIKHRNIVKRNSQTTDLDLGLSILEHAKNIYIEDDEELSHHTNRRVFISHSHCDNKIAVDIFNFLNDNVIPCWLDLYNICPGVPYAEAIMDGLEQSNTMVVIYSKNSIKSHDMLDEIQEAHTTSKKIIPFIIDRTPLVGQFKYYLARRQWISANQLYQENFHDLLSAINT